MMTISRFSKPDEGTLSLDAGFTCLRACQHGGKETHMSPARRGQEHGDVPESEQHTRTSQCQPSMRSAESAPDIMLHRLSLQPRPLCCIPRHLWPPQPRAGGPVNLAAPPGAIAAMSPSPSPPPPSPSSPPVNPHVALLPIASHAPPQQSYANTTAGSLPSGPPGRQPARTSNYLLEYWWSGAHKASIKLCTSAP